MKGLKRILSAMLVCILLVSSLPFSVLAENGETETGTVISVESKNSLQGGDVSVDINIKNKPPKIVATLPNKFAILSPINKPIKVKNPLTNANTK